MNSILQGGLGGKAFINQSIIWEKGEGDSNQYPHPQPILYTCILNSLKLKVNAKPLFGFSLKHMHKIEKWIFITIWLQNA